MILINGNYSYCDITDSCSAGMLLPHETLPSDAFCLHHTTMHHVRTVFRRTEGVPIASFDLDADVDSHSLPLATVMLFEVFRVLSSLCCPV